MKNLPASAEIFRANLKRLMEQHQPPLSQNEMHRLTGVGQRTFGRILAGDQIPTLEMCDKIARVFELRTWQMLQPDLNPADPPRLTNAREAELFRRWHLLMQELAGYKFEG